MSKKRKTRKDKVRSKQRQREGMMFAVKEKWLKIGTNKVKGTAVLGEIKKRHLRLDLTKTFVLSMLVLALELALWKYLSRH